MSTKAVPSLPIPAKALAKSGLTSAKAQPVSADLGLWQNRGLGRDHTCGGRARDPGRGRIGRLLPGAMFE